MNQQQTIVEFLAARLDEDEAAALAVDDNSPPFNGQWKPDGNALRTENDWVLFHGHGRPLAPGLVEHVARHDPARVLREVHAKRAILDEHADDYSDCRVCARESAETNSLGNAFHVPLPHPCPTLRHLATVYSDHPDYREEWRP